MLSAVEAAIRRGGPGDAGPAAELYLRARTAAAAAGIIPPLVHSQAEVREWMRHVVTARRETWLAELPEAMIVGLLVLDGDWIDQLYIDPAFTGNRLGGQLVDIAKRERPHGLRLWTFVSNRGAQRFYERHGFAAVQRTDGGGNEERSPDIQYVFRPATSGGLE